MQNRISKSDVRILVLFTTALIFIMLLVLLSGCAPAQTEQPTTEPSQPTGTTEATKPTEADPPTSPDYGHNVVPCHIAVPEALVWDYAEGYFAERLNSAELKGEYTSVAVDVPGEVFLDPLILQEVYEPNTNRLSMVVADGAFTHASGDPSKTHWERVYFLMFREGGKDKCMTCLTPEQIQTWWEDPLYADKGDPYSAAAVAEWITYHKNLEEYWKIVYDTDYYMAMQPNGHPFKELSSLIRSRTYHTQQPYTYGNFRLTDLQSGETYRVMPSHLFSIDEIEGLTLEWEKAVADGSGLFKDATVMVQLESIDGTWYAQIHNGSDANWIYLSECELYVPVRYVDYEDAARKINLIMDSDYERFLWTGLYIDHYGNGTPEEAMKLYLQGDMDRRMRTEEEGRSGRYSYGDVDIDNVHWEYAGDRMSLSYIVHFVPNGGEELKVTLLDPEGTSLKQKVTLIRCEDGYWRDHNVVYNYTATVIPAE